MNPSLKRQWITFGLLAVLFSPTLIRLTGLALDESMHSHVLLIPVITVYLIWNQRGKIGDGREERGERRGREQRTEDGGRRTEDGGLRAETSSFDVPSSVSRLLSPLLLVLGVAAASWGVLSARQLAAIDSLALQVTGFLLLIVAGLAWFQGVVFVKRHAFALAFLVFMIPMPTVVEHGLEAFFQNASAEAAYWMYQLTGTTVLRTGRTFEMAGLTIEVAQECSGIRSSYVLFIVSLLAGHMLLQGRLNRWLLTLFVIPLGILRNGFRILTISLLTMHWDPGIIHGPLHHRGGPVFFALSLIPLFGVLWAMRWWESRGDRSQRSEVGVPTNETR